MSGAFSIFGLHFALREPRLLWVAALLIAITLGVWLWRGWRALPVAGVILRALAFLLLGIALAGPLVARPTPTGATVFMVDRSRSMGDDDARLIAAQVSSALASRPANEPVGLVAFAEHPVVVYPVGQLTGATGSAAIAEALRAAAIGSRDYTDITGALQLAEALPVAGGRRLVLFSDGRETVNRAADWAGGAQDRGVVIDAIAPESRRRPNDLRLADLRVPQSTWQGDDVDIEAVVVGDLAGDAPVQLLVDGQATSRQTVRLTAGTTGATGTARFSLRPLSPGYHAFRVEAVAVAGDPIMENNALAATTIVRDRPSVLIVEGKSGNGDTLRRALERSSFTVTVRGASAVTNRPSDLTVYDSIVLADVNASSLAEGQQRALQEYVRVAGRGLVVTGGTNSFGKGNYEKSILEETLPVRVKPRPEGKRPAAALLLIIDASTSMNYPRNTQSPTRIEMAKTAAANAVRGLEPGDEIAVLTFSDHNTWITRLRTITSQSDIDAVIDQISRIQADGITEMYDALLAGIDELSHSTLGTRHIILFSDGEPSKTFSPDDIANRVKRSNLSLSTIAIGDGADVRLMERLGTGSNGRYHFAKTPQDIPRLTLEETEQLGGKTLATGDFHPVQTAPSSILRGLDPAKLPNLSGYQIVEARPDAQVILQSGRGEPILAQWQYGLGRVVVWTSDLGQEYATNWRDAEQFQPFWNGAVRWTLPAAVSPFFRLSAVSDGRTILLAVDAYAQSGATVNLTELRGQLRTASGATVEIVLPQSAPGRYEVRLAAPEPGAYSLALRQTRDGQAVNDTLGFSIPYPAELRGPTTGDSVLGTLADRTGGRVLADPGELFARVVVASTPRFQPIWPPFVIAALLCFLLDIALRLGHAATPGAALRRLLPKP